MMNELQVGEHDVLSTLRPDSLIGALVYLAVFVIDGDDAVAADCAPRCMRRLRGRRISTVP